MDATSTKPTATPVIGSLRNQKRAPVSNAAPPAATSIRLRRLYFMCQSWGEFGADQNAAYSLYIWAMNHRNQNENAKPSPSAVKSNNKNHIPNFLRPSANAKKTIGSQSGTD